MACVYKCVCVCVLTFVLIYVYAHVLYMPISTFINEGTIFVVIFCIFLVVSVCHLFNGFVYAKWVNIHFKLVQKSKNKTKETHILKVTLFNRRSISVLCTFLFAVLFFSDEILWQRGRERESKRMIECNGLWAAWI